MGFKDALNGLREKLTPKEQESLKLFDWLGNHGKEIEKAIGEEDQETARWHFQILNRASDILNFVIHDDMCFQDDSQRMSKEFQKVVDFIDLCLTKLLIFFPKEQLQNTKAVDKPHLPFDRPNIPDRRKALAEDLWEDLVDLEMEIGVQPRADEDSPNSISKPFPIEKAAKLYWALQIDKKLLTAFVTDLKNGTVKTYGAKHHTWKDAGFTATQLGMDSYSNQKAYIDKYPDDPDVRRITHGLAWITGARPDAPKSRTKKGKAPDIDNNNDELRDQVIPDYFELFGIDPKSLESLPEDEVRALIKKKFRELAFQFHPDRNAGNEQVAEEKFKKISAAYTILSDPDKRNRYLQTQGR